MIVGTLEMSGFVVIAGGIWCRLTGCVHAAAVYGMYVLGDLLVFAAMVLWGAWLAAAMWGASAVYWRWKWWRNRRKGGGRRALQALGAKSRAKLASMAARLTPSPIPAPAGRPR